MYYVFMALKILAEKLNKIYLLKELILPNNCLLNTNKLYNDKGIVL